MLIYSFTCANYFCMTRLIILLYSADKYDVRIRAVEIDFSLSDRIKYFLFSFYFIFAQVDKKYLLVEAIRKDNWAAEMQRQEIVRALQFWYTIADSQVQELLKQLRDLTIRWPLPATAVSSPGEAILRDNLDYRGSLDW